MIDDELDYNELCELIKMFNDDPNALDDTNVSGNTSDASDTTPPSQDIPDDDLFNVNILETLNGVTKGSTTVYDDTYPTNYNCLHDEKVTKIQAVYRGYLSRRGFKLCKFNGDGSHFMMNGATKSGRFCNKSCSTKYSVSKRWNKKKNTPSTPKSTVAAAVPDAPKRKKCGVCGVEGHNKRTCTPRNPLQPVTATVVNTPSPPEPTTTAATAATTVMITQQQFNYLCSQDSMMQLVLAENQELKSKLSVYENM